MAKTAVPGMLDSKGAEHVRQHNGLHQCGGAAACAEELLWKMQAARGVV